MEAVLQTGQVARENLRATVQGSSRSLPMLSITAPEHTGMSNAARIRAKKHFNNELMRRQQASAEAHSQV